MRNTRLNFERLNGKDYDIDRFFKGHDCEWPGDWEGRSLLAFVCHYQINGRTTDCLTKVIEGLKTNVNAGGYFGQCGGATINEQQLSGNSWYLRGLVKYYQTFNDPAALDYAKRTATNLYFPISDKLDSYPLERSAVGGVSGEIVSELNGWELSTDIGCLFMCVDGLAHLFEEWKEPRLKTLIDKLIDKISVIDKVKYHFQTHAGLSCARGILKMYTLTNDDKYLETAKGQFAYYIENGMTLTYENFNWYGRKDTWTEPCAVTDSFISATELYKITNRVEYLTLSRRIWFNGLQFCQRINGGVGPNSCVCEGQPMLFIKSYEAFFCYTMRYAEALLEYSSNKKMFKCSIFEKTSRDSFGRTFKGDRLIVECNHKKKMIFSCNKISAEDAEKLILKILF